MLRFLRFSAPPQAFRPAMSETSVFSVFSAVNRRARPTGGLSGAAISRKSVVGGRSTSPGSAHVRVLRRPRYSVSFGKLCGLCICSPGIDDMQWSGAVSSVI